MTPARNQEYTDVEPPEYATPHTGDNWAHRSRSMCCASCMWFIVKTADNPMRIDRTLGRCRRHAPTLNGFPAVFTDDWCGDHKLDENKQ